MAHNAEPMDIDDISEFDNKENSFHHNNVRQSTEKGYEELDVSELNMKLRYSFTPASSPMSKSYAGCLDNRSQDSDDLNNTVIHENDNLTHSLNSTVKNETLVKTPKLLPLQALPSEQFADGTRNASVLRPLDGTITVEDDKDISVTVTEAIDSDENISIPSTSSSPVCTPEATTPVKDAPKPTGSPIMRGLKTVLNMFRQSQSPSDENIQNLNEVTRTGNETLFEDQSIAQFAVASTPIAANKKERDGSTTRSSPLKESMSFKEDLEKEIKWNDDSTIIFSNKEKIPIHKLLFPPTKPSASDISNASINLGAGPNVAENLNKTVEPMEVSYNDSILRDKTMTEVQTDTLLLASVNAVKEIASETDESLFLDCETTLNETELLSDTKDDIAADLPAKDNKLEKIDSILISNDTTDFCKEEINEVVGEIKPQNMDSGHKETINNEAPSKNINIAEDLAPFPDNLDDNTPNTPTNVSVRSKTIDFIIESSVAFKQDKENTFEECLNTDLEVSKQILDHIAVNAKTETPLNETIDLTKVSEIPLPSDDEFDDAYLDPEFVKPHHVLTGLNTIPENNDSVLNKDVLDVQTINSETILANDEIKVPKVISSNLPESPMPADVADSVLINNTSEEMPVSASLAENKDNVNNLNTPKDKTESENKIVENLNVLTQVHVLESEKTASVEIINDFDLNVADKVAEVITEGIDNAGIENYETALPVPPVKQFPQNKEENDVFKADVTIIGTETKIAQSSGGLIVDVSTEKGVTENIQTVTVTQFAEPSDTLQVQIESQNNENNLVNDTAQKLKPEFIENAATESEITDVTQNIREVLEKSESNQETTNIAAVDNDETMPIAINFQDKNIEMVVQNNKENDALNTTQDLQAACVEKCDPIIGESKTMNNAETMNDEVFSVPSDLIQETAHSTNLENYHTDAELDKVATETVPQNNKDNVVMNMTQDIDPVSLESHVIDNTESFVTEATNASEDKQDFVDVQTNVQSIVEPVVAIDENDIPLNNQCYLKNISSFDSKTASEEPMEISMVELAIDIVDDKNTEMNQLMDTNKNTIVPPAEESKTETDDLEEELILSESNSPYISLTAQSDNPPEPPVESFENVRMSPPICSKGYNINFDDLDNVNPFISKTNVRMSPSACTSLNQTFEPIDKIVSSAQHSHEEEPKETVVIDQSEKTNESTAAESNTLDIMKSLTEDGDITFCSNKISNLDIKNVEPVYDHGKKMLQEEIGKKITEDVISVTNKTNEETVLPLSDTEAKPGSKTEHQEQQKQNPIEENKMVINEVVTNEQASTSHSSLEQSTYFSAESSGPDKIGYTLPDFDEINMNPFATKTKMRQSPQPELVLEDPFATKSKIASSPITAPTTLNVTVNLEDNEKDKDEVQTTNNDQKSVIEDKDVTSNDNNTNCSGSSNATDDKNITVQELHTDDEETMEGPFIDAELGNDDDKMSEFESEKVEFNEFTDLPTQETDENFEAGEMFIDADAFEFLMNQNKSNGVDDNGKESLFLKFDPLFSKRVNSDGVLDVLSKLQKRQSTPKKMKPPPPPQDLMVLENSPVAGPSHEHEGYVTPDESSDELNVTVSQKPTMAVPPAVNPVVVPRKKATTPVRTTSRLSMNFTSPAMTVIDRLLSLSGAFSPETTNVTTPQISGEQYEADRALVQLRELLAEKELNVHHLRGESKELRDRLAILETQLSTLEEEGEKRLKYINELNTKLVETNKENKGMASVVEEYERTIAGLIAGIEEDKKRHAEERTLLINDRDEQTAHLASMEVAFSDLHSKYEKSKQVIMSYKAKEDTYRQSIQEFEVNLEKMQNNYELLKQHATSKLNHANTELEKINRSHESEVLKLNAMIKRKDLHISSLEETLAQKTKANEELTAICDELINKVG